MKILIKNAREIAEGRGEICGLDAPGDMNEHDFLIIKLDEEEKKDQFLVKATSILEGYHLSLNKFHTYSSVEEEIKDLRNYLEEEEARG